MTDDYYEDESLTKCAENGFTPYAPALDDDIIADAVSLMQPQGRPPAANADLAARGNISLSPWYTLGGPTTHFAGNGADPWSEAGWGHKRAKLRNAGVTGAKNECAHDRASACDFGGSATTKAAASATGDCKALISQAGPQGTGTVTSGPTASGGSGSGGSSGNAAPRFGSSAVFGTEGAIAAYMSLALISGVCMVFL